MKQLKQKTYVQRALKETISGRANYLLLGCKKRSKLKNIECSLDREWFEEKLKIGKCEISGILFDLKMSETSRSNPFGPSPDRINVLQGYTPENTRLVLNLINAAMGDWGEAPFFKVVNAISHTHNTQKETK